jgi:hypothetical protein
MNGDLQDGDGVDIGNLQRIIFARNYFFFVQVKNINLAIYVLIHKAMQHLNVYQQINLLKHYN